ncbi:MAG: PAS domain-containing protein [Hyphomicrobiaceae bacterium]
MTQLPTFETPKLAAAVEMLTATELDALPFGVIGIDTAGHVRVFNKTEAVQSGYGDRPSIGEALYSQVAPCMDNHFFKGRIEKARSNGTLDLRFSFVGDFNDRNRELTVRVQSASDGGTWIFHERKQGLAP